MSLTCEACDEFREQRSQLIEDVALAMGEVTKLRRLNDFYRQRLHALGDRDRPLTAESSFARKKLSAVETSRNVELELKEVVSNVEELKTTIRNLQAENQMLKHQRDGFSEQVTDLNAKLELAINAIEDRVEEKLTAMRPSSAKSGFEDELKELKRLRVLMRFSELKKDSDKLRETMQYVSKLETENSGLKAQLEIQLERQNEGNLKHFPLQERSMPIRYNEPFEPTHELVPNTALPRNISQFASAVESFEAQRKNLVNEENGADSSSSLEVPSARARPPSAKPAPPKTLKQELTTAQALLELLHSRPAGNRLGSRPKTAGSSQLKKYSHF